MTSTELREDGFLRILWDEATQIIGIDWKKSTMAMTDDEMKAELVTFAGYVEDKKAPRILVDVTKFRHTMSPEVQDWRLKNISTRYNSAGVNRFAFVFPPDAQVPPTMNHAVAGEDFLTRGFNGREDAVRWLTGNQRRLSINS